MGATDATRLQPGGLAIAIRIQCPSPECGAVCSAADAASGRSVKCPKCGVAYLARATFDGQQSDTARTPTSPNEDPFPKLPAEFGRYRVLRLLGRGGMGAVYLAEDSQLGRRVALKIPFFDAKSSPQRLERFAREARAAAGLHHPNICTVFDAGEVGGRPFLTMRYVEGTPLEAEIERADGVSQARAAEVTRQVALALEFAHRAGIVHRDLKPANVMVAAGGEPVVMDFGLAKLIADADPNEAKLTRDGGVIGTPSYMSPEQIRGDAAAIGPASDIYSLGVMLFELLTGETPYRGSVGVVMGQTLAAPVRSVWELQPDTDPRLEAACRRAMAKEPAQRFASMAAFAAALDAYLKAPDAPPPPPAVTVTFDQMVSAPARPKPKKRRFAGVALAVALVLAAAGVSAAVVLRLETKDGALLVEIDDPEVEARLKGGTLTLCGPDGKVRYTLTAGERDKKLPAGPYTIRVEGADGLAVDTPEFTLKRGDKVTVKVTMELKAVAAAAKGPAKADAVVPPFSGDGFVPLFNGKDLTGWEPHPRWPGKWAVVDGVLTGRPDGGPLGFNQQCYLRTARKDYTDFHLRVEARVKLGSKGGVLVRVGDGGEIYPSTTDRWIKGYDIDIEARNGEPTWTGGIMCGNYILSPPTPPTAKPGEWFVMDVIVSGWDITVKVDGRVVNTFTDQSSRSAAGFLSLQAFGSTSAIEFRKVEVQEPPAPNAAAPTPGATPAADPDRKAAEYVLSLAGVVRVNDEERDISAVAGLPKEAFRLTSAFTASPAADDKGFGAFRNCKNLAFIQFRCQNVGDAGFSNLSSCTGLTNVELYHTQITNDGLAAFAKAGGLRVLILNDCKRVGDAGMAHFKDTKELIKLEFPGTQVTDAGLAYFKDCKQMRELRMENTQLGDAGLTHFKGYAALVYLNLDGSKVTDAALATLKGFPKLADLYVSRTAMTAKGVAAIRAALPGCKVTAEDLAPPALKAADAPEAAWLAAVKPLGVAELKEAVTARFKQLNPGFDGPVEFGVEAGQVVGLTLSTMKVKDLAPVRALPGLRNLNCDGTLWTKGGLLTDLSALRGLKLTSLNCSDNPLDDLSPLQNMPLSTLLIAGTRVADLSPLKGLPLTTLDVSRSEVKVLSPLKDMKLTYFSCHHTRVGDDNLAILKDMTTLRHLRVGGAGVGDAGMAHLMKLTGLEILAFTEAELTDDGVALVKNLKKLKTLELSATRLTDAGLTHLTGLADLQKLAIMGDPVTDAGLMKLTGLKRLTSLALSGCKQVTGPGIARVKAALPQCVVDQ